LSPLSAVNPLRRICSTAISAVLWSVLTLAGCAPFDKSESLTTTTAHKLPPLRPPPGAIQLDVAYIEWPADDPQLGDDLWRHIDQDGPVEAETRGRLRQNGFRVGIVGINPPVPLQRMLGMTSSFSSEPAAEQTKQLAGRSFFLISGAETEVQVSNHYPECGVTLETGGEQVSRQFANAVCKYKIRAARVQDGWVQLEFIPQIHHGDDQLRPEVGGMEWRYQNGQLTETFRPQRFEVRLSTGDMAVITAEEDAPGTLGQLFFRGPAALRPPRASGDGSEIGEPTSSPPEPDYPIQRLLIVRLAGMDEIAASRTRP
jgi:hypothetical protein